MELMTAINGRRSIRKYDGEKKLTKEQIDEIISAAIMAPSWKNSETGRYYIITDEDKKAYVRSECLPGFNAENCKDASAIVVTTFVKGISGFGPDGMPANELSDGWGAYDLGLQNQNLMLKAHEMGFGTLIMGLRDEDKLRKYAGIPENESIVAVISIGAPDTEPNAPVRKKLDEVRKYL